MALDPNVESRPSKARYQMMGFGPGTRLEHLILRHILSSMLGLGNALAELGILDRIAELTFE